MITGFPSPAQGYEDNRFDLNTLYIKHPAATVFMTVDTDRYKNMCIFNGDLLIIDRAKKKIRFRAGQKKSPRGRRRETDYFVFSRYSS